MKYFNLSPQKMKTIFLKITFLLYIGLLINCTSNNEPQDQLPPITQTGANTFGAVVDGRVLIPKDSYSTTPGNNLFKGLKLFVGENFLANNGDDKWELSAGNFKISPSLYVYIYIPRFLDGVDKYSFKESDGLENTTLSYPHLYCHIEGSNNTYLSFNNSGTITFSRLDINNGIYSGIFSVQLKNKNDENDIIEITDGRFDINLNTVNE